MSVLSDSSLRDMGLSPEHTGPASVDLHLGDSLLRLGYGAVLDPEQDQTDLWSPAAQEDGRWWLSNGGLHLGVTQEDISVPGDCVALLHGISSLGRLGLLIHATAGLIDPGWSGRITLEIVSLGGTILLRPGMRIGQLTYHRLDTLATRPYSGRYLGDQTPTPSRSYLDVKP
jgi:dCTP deaminase